MFAELYERYYSRVYRLAYGMTARHDSAEDLAQEVFIRAYQKIELFSGQSSYSTWFYRLALNHCLNHCWSVRRRKQAELGDLEQPALTPDLKQMEKKVLQKEMEARHRRFRHASVYDNGTVYVSALDKAEASAMADPIVAGGVVYFGVVNLQDAPTPRPFYAVDSQTGEELWKFQADARIIASAAIAEGAIYFATNSGSSGTLYAIE